MTSQDSLLGKLELAVLRHPILVVAALLLLSTGIAVLLPTRDPNVGATIWLITAGAAMIWRWTVLKEKHPGVSAAPGLTGLVGGWWGRLTSRRRSR